MVTPPTPLQWPFIVGTGAHAIAAIALFASTLFWKSVYKSGSRMGFAWLMALTNCAFAVLYGLRWIDGETKLRDDGVTIFPPREIIHAFTMVLSMGATALYTRFHCMTVGPSIAMWAGAGALLIMRGSQSRWEGGGADDLALYLWILGALANLVAVLQLVAWLLVPDQTHVKGDKARRRQDIWAMAMVGIASFYLVAYAVLEMLGTSFSRFLDMDEPLYEWLHLGACTLPIGLALSIVGILTYWNDVKFYENNASVPLAEIPSDDAADLKVD